MIVAHENAILGAEMNHSGVVEVCMKTLIGPKEGWDGHVMRIVEIGEGGYSPKHDHPWPHINYMVEGEGVLFLNGKENPVKAGSYAYVPAGELHQFKNTGKGTFKFICIVPEEGHK